MYVDLTDDESNVWFFSIKRGIRMFQKLCKNVTSLDVLDSRMLHIILHKI